VRTNHVSEAEVVHSLKTHLLRWGLRGARLRQVVVDADPSYMRSRYRRELEPLATIRIDGSRPDLVCTVEHGSRDVVVGFEVKARQADWWHGLAQARRYRSGVHHAYLALPGAAAEIQRNASEMSQESGVGVLALEQGAWQELLAAADPRPLPWMVEATASVLAGVPAARRLQLNHPLNYLVVPLLVSHHPRMSAMEALEAFWPDLRSASSRQMAVDGAASLGLLDRDGNITAEGSTVADLLECLGFAPERRLNKRQRLAEAAPAVAAVARSVLLRQPAVQLLIEVLRLRRGKGFPISKLYESARRENDSLAGALFLSDPSLGVSPQVAGTDFRPTTVYQFKQILWHAGILETKAHGSAGRGAENFDPQQDLWSLEPRLYRRIRTET
jgi:hypothetical protein